MIQSEHVDKDRFWVQMTRRLESVLTQPSGNVGCWVGLSRVERGHIVSHNNPRARYWVPLKLEGGKFWVGKKPNPLLRRWAAGEDDEGNTIFRTEEIGMSWWCKAGTYKLTIYARPAYGPIVITQDKLITLTSDGEIVCGKWIRFSANRESVDSLREKGINVCQN